MLKQLSRDPSLTLLTIRGVPIRFHASFLLLPLWSAGAGFSVDSGRGATLLVAFILLLYVCAAVHELGHIIPARALGAQITHVRISGLGAFVQVDSPLQSGSRQDLLIALGGPAATALLSLGLWQVSRPDVIMQLGQTERGLLAALAGTNMLLTVFNLLPVMPMDGGRILNAVLAISFKSPRATRLVSAFGQVMAVVMVIMAAVLTSNVIVRGTAILSAVLISFVSYKTRRSSETEV